MTRTGFRLKKPLGLAYTMDDDDVLKTKIALRDLGHLKKPDYGLTAYPDQPMIDSIRDFQRSQGLEADGVAKPGGPTEHRINRELANSRNSRQTRIEKHHRRSHQRALKSTKLPIKKEIPVKIAFEFDENQQAELMRTNQGGFKPEESI